MQENDKIAHAHFKSLTELASLSSISRKFLTELAHLRAIGRKFLTDLASLCTIEVKI
jgi:hypothetical protein